jgi:uncharacterized protein (UPF0332 family)
LKNHNPDFSDLIKQESLKEEKNIGQDQVMKLLNRAKKDLQTAKSLLDDDEAVAMTMVYDAMFHSANALIRLYNLRPGKVRQHIGLIEATSRILGTEVKDYIFRFDKLRIKRNQFEYQAIFDFSRIQIDNNLAEAEKFVDIIEKFITERINQQSFNI